MIDKFSRGFINSVYEFNDFTINELLCKLAQKMDEVITQSNESFNYLEWLKGQGLSDEVIKTLTEWKENGSLNEIINQLLFGELNDKINNNKIAIDNIENKVNKICYTIDTSLTLNNSINTLVNNIESGKILIPPGDYVLDGEITINKSNIELEFLKGSKVIVNYVDKNVLTILPSLENIKITGFNVVGNANRMNDQYAIVVGRKSKNVTIRDCYFDNFNGGIMLVANNSLITIDNNKFFNMLFPTDNSEATGVGKTGGYGVVLQGANNCTVVNNYFDKTVERHCIYMGRIPDSQSVVGYNNSIINNRFNGVIQNTHITNYEFLVKIMGNNNVTISGNTFDGGLGHLWLIAAGTVDPQPRNITVVGNVFKNIHQGSATSSSGAIATASNPTPTTILENCTITGNTIIDCDCRSAMKIDYMKNSIISNNTIKDCTGYGILLQFGVKDSMVNNNIIYNVVRGIQLKGDTTNGDSCDIKGNQIKECEFGIWLDNIRFGNITSNNIRTNKYQSIILNSGCFEGVINNNKFDGGNKAVAIKPSNNKDFFFYDNVFGTHTVEKVENSTVRLLKPFLVAGNREQKEFTGTSIPTDGTWTEGDKMFYTVPGSGGYIGAVCTVGGTPGTWKNFGQIIV